MLLLDGMKQQRGKLLLELELAILGIVDSYASPDRFMVTFQSSLSPSI